MSLQHYTLAVPANFRTITLLFCFCLFLGLFLDSPQRIAAQRLSGLDGYTPPGTAKGAAGTYALSDFNVSYATGNLNFRLPIMGIGGRGGTGYTMVLPIETKWHVESERYAAHQSSLVA